MAMKLADISGNPYIGVFCRLIGDIAICPLEVSDEFTSDLEEGMGVKWVKATLGNTNLHGSLIGANSKGFIVPYFYDIEEIKKAFSIFDIDMDEKGIKGAVSDDPLTAWGNNILASEKAVLANPEFRGYSLRLIEDILDVEVVKGTIAGLMTVGSVAVLNSKGMVVHPKISDEEKEQLEDLFGVEVQISTANFGSPYLGASIMANDRGAMIGNKTSGVEMNRIENTLDLIE